MGPEVQPPALLHRHLSAVEAALRSAVQVLPDPIQRLLQYHLGWVDVSGCPVDGHGGKRLRPMLCLFSTDAVGGSPVAAVPAAAALELVHNFSLIHDDIQDRDRERRHRPTVWAVWGQPAALAAGDAMMVLADLTLLALCQRGFPPAKALRASHVITSGYLEMIEGQYLDMSYEGRFDITTADYLIMVSKKTGALLETATHLGALLGCDDETRVDALRHAGRSLGIAFQVRDDVLGIWGDTAVTGKAAGADIRRRKKSLPIVCALQSAGPAGRARLAALYRQDALSDHDVAEVLGVLETSGAREQAQRLAEEHCAMALEWAWQAALPPWAQAEFRGLVDFMLYRDR